MQRKGWTVVCLLALASLGCAAQSAFPSLEGIQQVQSAAQAIARRYATAVESVLGGAWPPPAIDVLDSPYLAYFDPRSSKVVVPFWPPQKPSTLGFFLDMTDGDPAAAESFFEALFDWFLVAHELSHWLQAEEGWSLSRYEAETLANDLAVAFFKDSAVGEARLLELDAMLSRALSHLSDPGIPGIAEEVYFNAFYMVLTQDPWKYGYYQFRFIRDSIARRESLSLAELLLGPQTGEP